MIFDQSEGKGSVKYLILPLQVLKKGITFLLIKKVPAFDSD